MVKRTAIQARMKKNLFISLGIVLALLLVAGNTIYNNSSVTVAFGGDTLFGGYYSTIPPYGTMDDLAQMINSYIRSHGEQEGIERFVGYAFKNIKPIFARAAYVVVNLEGPIVATPDTFVPKVFPLRQHVRTPEILKEAGITLVSLANNHMYDFNGAKGVEETMQRLEDAGIAAVGAGRGEDAYAQAFGYTIKETKGVKIAFFGVTDVIEPGDMGAEAGKAGVAALAEQVYYRQSKKNMPYLLGRIGEARGVAALQEQAHYRESKNMRYLLGIIGEARKEADFCVVLLHAGPPKKGQVLEPRQQQIVDILLEAGVDVIIGTHSHSQQPIKEIHDGQGRLRQVAFYGIGNLVFGGCKGRQDLSLIALITFHKEEGVHYLSYEGVAIRPNEDGTFQPIVVQ